MARSKGNTSPQVGDDSAFEVTDERGHPRFGMVYADDMDTDEFRGLTGAAVRCYLLLTAYAGANRDCWPRQRTLRKITGLHPDTVQKALTELAAAGLLRKEVLTWDDSRNKYVLLRPPSRR